MFASVSAGFRHCVHEHAEGVPTVRERRRPRVDAGGGAVHVIEEDAGHRGRHSFERIDEHVDGCIRELAEEP